MSNIIGQQSNTHLLGTAKAVQGHNRVSAQQWNEQGKAQNSGSKFPGGNGGLASNLNGNGGQLNQLG
jgi:hypothetical protein